MGRFQCLILWNFCDMTSVTSIRGSFSLRQHGTFSSFVGGFSPLLGENHRRAASIFSYSCFAFCGLRPQKAKQLNGKYRSAEGSACVEQESE
jgi:hypothetical protein